MAYARRNDGFGRGSSSGSRGGHKFGGAPRGGRSFTEHGGGAKPMFPATCADCGARCEVPFRPNGRKPVLCQNCFGQENGQETRFSKREESGRSKNGSDIGVAEQLRSINAKLDMIMKALKENDFSL